MFAELESQIIASLYAIFDRFGWLGVVGLVAFENATGITPSEVILGMAGWMLLAAREAPATLIFVGGLYAALGSSAGASITYWLARLGGRPAIDRVFRWFRVNPRHIQRVEVLFKRWGPGLVLFGRLIPGVRTLVSIPAGLARMHYPKYLLFTFIGTYLWCTLLIGLGYIVGHEWPLVSEWIKRTTPWAIAGLVMIGGIGLTIGWLIQRWLRYLPVPIRADE